jgi:hypothetical protein
LTAPPDPAASSVSVRDADDHPLRRLLQPAWPFGIADAGSDGQASGQRIVCRQGQGPPTWLDSGGWRILASPEDGPGSDGEVLATFTVEGGGEVRVRRDSDGDIVVPFSFAEAYRSYAAEVWRSADSPRGLSERQLSLFYRVKNLIPRRAQLAARRRLIRYQGVPTFPAWPLDTSMSKLLRLFAGCALRAAGQAEAEFAWFWPGGHHAALILTHDVEGDEGIRLALELADLEQGLGFRSAFNFGAWYDVDPGVLRELTGRGFEIGMHGLVHDRTLFSSRDAFEASVRPLMELAERLGAVGFRSPATHRVFDWLGELPVEYDCTIPNSDPYEPQPGGCCSIWPFFIGPVVELPYTLPQDHTLLTLLGHRSPSLWLEQATAIELENGLIQCVTHPDRGYLGDSDKRAIYGEFLRGLAERGKLWRALPREVASWWRDRSASHVRAPDLRVGKVRADEGPGLAAVCPPT